MRTITFTFTYEPVVRTSLWVDRKLQPWYPCRPSLSDSPLYVGDCEARVASIKPTLSRRVDEHDEYKHPFFRTKVHQNTSSYARFKRSIPVNNWHSATAVSTSRQQLGIGLNSFIVRVVCHFGRSEMTFRADQAYKGIRQPRDLGRHCSVFRICGTEIDSTSGCERQS